MTFKTRAIPKQFDTVHDFNIKNLVVGGCSFTYNNHESTPVTWPYYLRDLGGFTNVYDCSMPGAGNNHISDTLIWELETSEISRQNTLVVVMWSGNDRDDYICPVENIEQDYPYKFYYNDRVMSGTTGGLFIGARGNTLKAFKEFSQTKSRESRAIENYLCITKTYEYLKSKGYKFVFLNWVERGTAARTTNFNIQPFLPEVAQKKLNAMATKLPQDLYEFAIKQDLLASDDFHPSPKGHLEWTRQILLPKLISLFG